MIKKLLFGLMCLLGVAKVALSQQTAWKQRTLVFSSDTMQLDIAPLVPGSISFLNEKNEWLKISEIAIYEHKFLIKSQFIKDTIELRYRVFSYDFTAARYLRDEQAISDIRFARENPFNLLPADNAAANLLDFRQLEKQGSISRGLGLGNNQDLVLNAGFNLQLSGKLTDSISLIASMTDNNLPFQPDGFTQQLQDFDRVFVQVGSRKTKLTVGDYDLTRPNSHFLNFFKNVKGASIDHQSQIGKRGQLKQKGSVSAARGQFGRNVFLGREGNQGPYRLTGQNPGQFIVVLAGSERVYIDGELLRRGEQYDYIIDYNTADLTFTPNRIITNQSRIIVEFEYANQAYLRTIAYYGAEYNYDDRLQLSFNTYREGDGRNQPLFQDLSNTQRQFLRDAGNGTAAVFFPSAVDAGFDGRQVRYKRIDSLGFSPVYVYSINPDSATYAVSFSLVGQGRGDYVPAVSTANGRVFQWVAPQIVGSDTIRRGSYAAVVQLIPPTKLQMSTLQARYRPDAYTQLMVEVAQSDNQTNLFSANPLPKGHAIKTAVHTRRPLRNKPDWKWELGNEIEWLNAAFRIVQPYRNMEFARDWNLAALYAENSELTTTARAGLSFKDSSGIGYNATLYRTGNGYDGLRQKLDGQWVDSVQRAQLSYDLLRVGTNLFAGDYVRIRGGYNRKLGRWILGGAYEQENNLIFLPGSDTLSPNSFRFDIFQLQAQFTSTTFDKLTLRYVFRDDQLPFATSSLQGSQSGHNYTLAGEVNRWENHQLKLTATVRRLLTFDTPVQRGSTSYNFLGQLDYSGQFANKAVALTSFYTFGQGQELRRELAYLEVPRGQGTFVWNDYNGNGVQELDEFEQAVFADQANYIRVFIPGNTFIPTFSTRFSQQINLQPDALYQAPAWVKRFSNLTSFAIDRKEQGTAGLAYLNPVRWNVADSNLVSAAGNFRNTFFFNRNNPRFGIDLTYQQQVNRLLLANGTETRSSSENGLRMRWNPVSNIGIESQLSAGNRVAAADLFAVRNYNIAQWEWLPVLNWAVNQQWRMSTKFALRDKRNTLETDFNTGNLESARIREAGLELNYNAISNSSVRVSFSLVQNRFNGNPNNPAAFEILQGLLPGNNQLWSVGLFRKLSSNLQLNFTYDGRAAENSRTVHTGRVQARLNF